MKTSILNKVFAAAIISAVTLTSFSETTSLNSKTQPVFNAAVKAAQIPGAGIYSQLLNQNLSVTYAVDNGVDITNDMSAWTFRFNGNFPGGEARGWNDILAVTGSWSMAAEGSDNISIMFSSRLSQAAFMSRTWTIASNTGKGAGIVLTAPDGDEIHLLSHIQ